MPIGSGGAATGTSGVAADGWVDDTATTWTYVSATSFKVAGADVTARFQKGTRLKLTQSATVKYFVVTAASFSTDTTVTITGGDDYTLANSAISLNYYSYVVTPQGYPIWFNYTPSWTGFSAAPTVSVARFAVTGRLCTVSLGISAAGTSNATTLTFSLPISADSNIVIYQGMLAQNASALLTTPSVITASGTTATAWRNYDLGTTTWTASGTKYVQGQISYGI